MRLVDTRPGERRATWSAFATLLGVSAAHALLETGRDALFLAKMKADRLPWMYMAIAGVGLLLSSAKPKRAPGPVVVPQALMGAAVVTGAFWALAKWPSPWLLYALYVWSGLFASWVIVRFWMVLGGAFDLTQAKRLYGFVGAGAVLGAVAGAALARGLAEIMPARHFLLASSALLLLTAMGPGMVLSTAAAPQEERARLTLVPAGSPRRALPLPPKSSLLGDVEVVRASPYLMRLLALVLASTVTVTVVDYLFKSTVAAHVPAAQLGAYFANVAVATNLASLAVQLIVVGWLLRTFGVHRALWVMPVLLVFGSSAVFFGGGLLAALAVKGVDGSLRYSLHKTSLELLGVPISDEQRTRGKPLIDLLAPRTGQALASVFILAIVALGMGARALALVAAVLAGAWIVSAARLRQHYLDIFRTNLRRGYLDYRGELPPLDLGALETLFATLSSSKDSEVLTALDLLEAQHRTRAIPPFLLYHPSPAVVIRVLEIFVHDNRTDFLGIAERLDEVAPAAVRAAALRARAAVAPDPEALRRYMADASPEVQATALVGLIASEAMVGEEAARALRVACESTLPRVRTAIARAIRAERNKPTVFVDALLRLATDTDVDVSIEAAAAMATVHDPRCLDALVHMLPDRERAPHAREALAAYGPEAVDHLGRVLADSRWPLHLRALVPRAMAFLDPQRVKDVLILHLDAPEGIIRFRALRALWKIHARDGTVAVPHKELMALAESTLRAALRVVDWRSSLHQGKKAVTSPALELLLVLLRDKEKHAVERAFLILDLLYPGENFARVHRGLQRADGKARASSRELIENVVRPPLRQPLVALLDDRPDADRLEGAAPFYVAEARTYEAVLSTLMAHRDDTIRALAVYHVAKEGLRITAAARPAPVSGKFAAEVTARARELAGAHG